MSVECEKVLTAIYRLKPAREYKRNLKTEGEEQLINLIFNDPQVGHSRWTLHLLAEEIAGLDETNFKSISHEILRQLLKEHPNTTALQLLNNSN